MKYKQLLYTRTVCVLMSVFLLLAGCEYDLGKNYEDQEYPPLDESKVEVSLNMLDEDGMFIVKHSYLVGYEIKVPGYMVTRCIFRLGDKTWEMNKVDEMNRFEGSFTIDVNVFPNNIYDFSCEIYVKNVNGSISGQAGLELYAGKKDWKLRVLAFDSSDKLLPWRITDDEMFEVTWDIDESLRDAFERYEFRWQGRKATYIYTSRKFDDRACLHSTDGRFEIDSCEVFFYPKDVTARPFSLGKADLRDLKPSGELSNTAKTKQK